MKKLVSLMAVFLLVACGINLGSEDDLTITSKFKGTWNIYEELKKNSDGTITYYALPWGGLVGMFKERNMPVDWSGYESISFEFVEPTPVPTQIMITDNLMIWGKPGITSLTCSFDGQDVRSVSEVALQAADTAVIKVKRVYLTPGNVVWDSTPIWKGKCSFGNWESGFIIKPENFTTAYEGDKLEFIYTTDMSNPNGYWQFKTVYNETDSTLEGNSNELNYWGCATVGKGSTVYRIPLTSRDVSLLREKGLFVNGYYNNVVQCNLLRKDYESDSSY